MSKKAQLIFMYAIIFLFSFGFIMYSALAPAIRSAYALNAAQVGWFGSCLAGGQFIILLFNDALSRRFSAMQLILFCFLAYLASLTLLCFVPPYPVLLTSFFVIGMSLSLVNVIMSARISDMFGDQRDRYLNYFHGIYGIGSMTGPLLPSALNRAGLPWTASYGVVAAFCAVMMLSFLRVDLKAEPAAGVKEQKEENSLSLLKDARLAIISSAALLSMGMDMTLCSWISSYLVDVKQMAEAAAGLAITTYWLGSAAGRLLYPALFGKLDVKKYLIGANVFAAIAFIIATRLSGAGINAGLAFVGFATGSGFPLMIGMVCALHPNNCVPATNDVTFAGSIGGTIFPWLAGVFTQSVGYPGFIALMTALFAGVPVLMICLHGVQKKWKGGKTYA